MQTINRQVIASTGILGEVELSPFPPYVGRYRETFNRLDNGINYRYTVLMNERVNHEALKLALRELHNGKLSFLWWGNTGWIGDAVKLKGNEVWEYLATLYPSEQLPEDTAMMLTSKDEFRK